LNLILKSNIILYRIAAVFEETMGNYTQKFSVYSLSKYKELIKEEEEKKAKHKK
jgi:hypothetical protein